MHKLLLQRLLLLIPTLLLVSIAVFGMVRAVPGDVISILLAEQKLAGNEREELAAKLGLDKPIVIQYVDWVSGVVRGDLGESLFTGHPVREDISEKFKVTAFLAILATIISLVIAIPIGAIAALRQGSILDYFSRSFALLGISLPNFWVGVAIIMYGSLWFRYAPPLRYASVESDPLLLARQLFLPALVLGWSMAGVVMRMVRTALLEVLRDDYIRTARAKGLRERVILWRHAMKNAMIPVITISGIQLAALFGGTVVIESVFNIPGVGRLLVESVALRDYPVVQGIALVMTVLVLLVNLAVDISYRYLDPRIRLS